MPISNPLHKKWDSSKGRSPLSDFVKHIHPVSDELLDIIDEYSFTCSVSKGKYILKSGDLCKDLYLIKKGIARSYIKDSSKDITTWITAEGEIITSIRGFHMQQPSMENIQAIEDCELIGASYEGLEDIYERFPEMNIVGRKLLVQYYIDAEERAYIARLSNASTKYGYFLETKGHLANRIHLKYIASFLGMTIETLSRIRSKLGKTKR